MWVQVIQSTLKPGKEAELAGPMEQLKALEQPGSGLIQSIAAVSRQDRQRAYRLTLSAPIRRFGSWHGITAAWRSRFEAKGRPSY